MSRPAFLSDLIGAHDAGDFALQVEKVSPTSPPLKRGSIVSLLAGGTVTLAGAEASTPDTAYGIVLDPEVDPTKPDLQCSVARNGVFNALALSTDGSTNVKAFEPRLKEINILLEKVNLLP